MSVTTAPTAGSVWQIVEYKALVFRRFWRSALVGGVLTPLFYVLALGVGLGTIVNKHGNNLGVPYLVYVAPAFLAAAALQIGSADASYPVLAGFKWVRTYHGIAATPLRPAQICDAELIWIALRLLVNSTIYLAIMAAFGAAQSAWVVLAVPAAVLTGAGFAAVVVAISATVQREGTLFNVLFRFVVTPMFLFSGTFYPISQLPRWGQVLAWLFPLWHGTELARDAALGGGLTALAVAGHIGYLLLWLVVGLVAARWRFRVRLTR